MSDLRTAAQQALEFLDAEFGWSPGEAPRIDALRAALAQQAEPTGKKSLQVEPVATVAENATTQQRVVETPPSDYRRGYWDGFNIGKREGRIEAEDAAKQAEPVEPVATLTAQRDALLEALKEITPSICHVSIVPEEKCAQCGRIARARAAIKAVEDTK